MPFAVFYGAASAGIAPAPPPFTVTVFPSFWDQSIFGPVTLNKDFTATPVGDSGHTYSWQWISSFVVSATVTLTNATSAVCNMQIQGTAAFFWCQGTLRCTVTTANGSVITNVSINVRDDLD